MACARGRRLAYTQQEQCAGVGMTQFSTRRGRPPKARIEHDYGTPELQAKRAVNLTDEAIDVCLERRIISRAQHWAGMHLRWLYTVRYGAPSLTSHWWRISDDTRSPRTDHSNWRDAREQEYNEARALLTSHKCYEPVMQVVVYNDMPHFLRPDILHRAMRDPGLLQHIENERDGLQWGLQLLRECWENQAKNR